jgi:hypothetical protein
LIARGFGTPDYCYIGHGIEADGADNGKGSTGGIASDSTGV